MSLDIKDLTVRLYSGGEKESFINVVRSVDLGVENGKIAAIVGESGSGKSMLGLSVLRLNPPVVSKIVSGSVKIKCPAENPNSEDMNKEGVDVLRLPLKDLPSVRGRLVSMIFQDPNTSLNPVMRIGDQITEAILAHKNINKKEARETAVSYLNYMKIDGASRFNSYPHELSGGQRQRVMIAMALVLHPCFLIADEPTTALDITTTMQVLKLLEKIRNESNIGIIFITHDLGIARNIADSIYVFYAGEVMEYGKTEEVISMPAHPYTISLIKSVPGASRGYRPKERLSPIPGYLEKTDFSETRCRFYPRCFKKDFACLNIIPLREVSPGRFARCVKV